MPAKTKPTKSEQPKSTVSEAFEQLRTPFFVALGAGDLAAHAVMDVVGKARRQVNQRAEVARSVVDELPTDVSSLREKLDPTELRKLFDQYAEVTSKLYRQLAQQGVEAWDKLREQPQISQAVEIAQQRTGSALENARGLVDGVVGRVRGTQPASEPTSESPVAKTKSSTGDEK